ncbi:MAG: chemotaxis protein CheB, partial [Bacteroidota bacterium]
MPVIFLTEDIFPEPNTIYLRPPDKEVEAHGGKLCLSPRDQTNDSLYLPIDHFLLSLATDQKSYAIAIILSGMGSDGSRGIKSIKEKGGIVLVQSPESAQFSGMPNAAIRFDVADFIGTAPEIATTLAAIAQREPAPDQNRIFEAVPASEFDRFVEKILELIGEEIEIDFTRYRASTIRRRIEKRLLIHMIDEPADYLEMLVQDQEELTLLAQSFLIGVTRFFRDPPAYELLREQLAPQLAERARQGTPLRVWVPACSTGEEAYSIAMVLDEYLSTHHPQLEFKVLASDLDPKAVQIASEAFYPDNVAADVPTTYLEKYLMSSHGGYR